MEIVIKIFLFGTRAKKLDRSVNLDPELYPR